MFIAFPVGPCEQPAAVTDISSGNVRCSRTAAWLRRGEFSRLDEDGTA